MYRFWDTIIDPAFHIVQPRSIVEIGVFQGQQTKRILEYCKKTGAVLHSIDPIDFIDANTWMRKYEPSFVFHQDLSLNVLGKLERIDAVLIDGDHNWYTVYHELTLIGKYAQKNGRFPIVFLHDTGWPYGRRDMYHAPENIPDAYKKAYASEGMLPTTGMLSKTEGINAHMLNAVEENDIRNGVRTAVEDFIRDSEIPLHFTHIPGAYGLGVIVSQNELDTHHELRHFIGGLNLSESMRAHVEDVELQRIEQYMQANKMEEAAMRMKTERDECHANMERGNAELARIKGSYSWTLTIPTRALEKGIRLSAKYLMRLGAESAKSMRDTTSLFSAHSFLGPMRGAVRRIRSFLHSPARTREKLMLKNARRNDVVIVEPDWSNMRDVTIIIPVYNSYDETIRCIESVLNHSHASHRIVIVDDASTDARVCSYLSSVADRLPSRVTVVTNERNEGFVQSANTGMRLAANNDVILLNNDTVVPPTWVERLQEAAYSLPKAASITPLSNEASVYSVLRDSIDSLLKQFNVADIDRHIERHSQLKLPVIPTAVGFCMFIKRDALDIVGLFDERFGIGYGEENDWCMRAHKAGFRHHLHDGCFVYHTGHVAMKEAGHTNGEGSIESHEKLLQSLHPTYAMKVRRFLASGVMDGIRTHIEQHIGLCKNMQKRIGLILHNPIRSGVIGGVEYHVTDLQKTLGDTYEFFTISSVGKTVLVQSEQKEHATERLYQYDKKGASEQDTLDVVDAMIKRFDFDLVHVHHLMTFTFAILPLIEKQGIPIVYTAHDWLFVNHSNHPICTDDIHVIDRMIVADRMRYIRSVQALVTPSKLVMDIAQSAYGALPAIKRVFPYGMDMQRLDVRPTQDGWTICFLSYSHADHKGKALVEKLVPLLVQRGCRIIFLGSRPQYWGAFNRNPMVTFGGLYERSSVGEHLQKTKPHLACILSTTPETYCYAADEAWHAGIPLYTTPIGAPAERIRAAGGGRVAPSFDVEEMARDIMDFLQTNAYQEARDSIGKMRFVGTSEMGECHRQLYEELTADHISAHVP